MFSNDYRVFLGISPLLIFDTFLGAARVKISYTHEKQNNRTCRNRRGAPPAVVRRRMKKTHRTRATGAHGQRDKYLFSDTKSYDVKT